MTCRNVTSLRSRASLRMLALALACSMALVCGLACGKYGPPERLSQPNLQLEAEPEGDEQPNSRKP